MSLQSLSRLRLSLRLTYPLSRCISTLSTERSGSVWSFGDNSNGALGLPSPLSDSFEPTKVPLLPSNIAYVSAGHYHSLAVTVNGEVWAWGRNEEGQLGRGTNSPRSKWSCPERIQGLEKISVCSASGSGVVSSVIGSDGSVWVWGKSKRGQLGLGKDITESTIPSKIEALSGHHIVKVLFGWGHALALTKEGKLFGWGYTEDGRLGQISQTFHTSSPVQDPMERTGSRIRTTNSMLEEVGRLVEERIKNEENMPIIWDPCLIGEVCDLEVADVACGLDHSLVLCCDGTILSGGDNTYGQLGHESREPKLLPITDIGPKFTPISLSAGLGHCLALCNILPSDKGLNYGTATGILSWGWNCSSQLGRSGKNVIPGFVEGLNFEKLVSVSAGRVHSVALTLNGEVWAWGSGRNGRLGLGHSMDEAEPALIESLEGREVLQAVAGFDHNLLLVAE